MAEQQLVEIARALGAQARVLLMDEPTASLAETEAERLLELVRELRGAAAWRSSTSRIGWTRSRGSPTA